LADESWRTSLGRVLDESWTSLGRVLDESWTSLGRSLGDRLRGGVLVTGRVLGTGEPWGESWGLATRGVLGTGNQQSLGDRLRGSLGDRRVLGSLGDRLRGSLGVLGTGYAESLGSLGATVGVLGVLGTGYAGEPWSLGGGSLGDGRVLGTGYAG
jgi:hypothetical protein